MAHFSDCGAQCADPYCRQRDLLPVRCDACEKTYCSEHFKYEAHQCTKGMVARAAKDKRVIVCPLCAKAVPLVASEDENAVWERHATSNECQPAPTPVAKPRCPVAGCKEKLTTISTFACGSCGKKVCMKHRYEDAHECRPALLPHACRDSSRKGGVFARTTQSLSRLVR